MSLEETKEIHTAQDLFEFLLDIPKAHRDVLPIDCIDSQGCEGYNITIVEAFRYFTTEGNEERGLRFIGDKS